MIKRLITFCLFLVAAGCAAPASHDTAVTAVETEGMDKDKIRQTIREHIVPIRHCYEKELKTSPGLSGKLVMEWDIGDLGKVTRVASVKPFNPNVDRCVAEVIKGTLFESPPKGKTGNVRFPFEFSPNPEKAVK